MINTEWTQKEIVYTDVHVTHTYVTTMIKEKEAMNFQDISEETRRWALNRGQMAEVPV